MKAGSTVCMVVSRVGGRNLTLPERRSLSTSPWDLDTESGNLAIPTEYKIHPALNKSGG